MVAKEVFHSHGLGDGVFAHGDALRPCKVVFGHGASGSLLEVAADLIGGRAPHDGFHLFSIPVIGKLGNHRFPGIADPITGGILTRKLYAFSPFMALPSNLLVPYLD